VPRQPHVVLITADALRADHLSVNGYERPTSPNIDAFAGRSHHFTQMISVIPKTSPSFTTFFTGRHPQEHGVRTNPAPVPSSLRLLAEQFRALGYRTAAFIGSPVLRESLGFARGFDVYRLYGPGGETRAVTEAFLTWAEDPWDQPTFVWIHYLDPHGPYRPPPEFEALFIEDALSQSPEVVSRDCDPGKHQCYGSNKILGAIPKYQQIDDEVRLAIYIARYDAEVRFMDSAFAEVIAFLEERNLFDGSVVVFTSDHGESLGEHDLHFEHGWFAYEPTLHVPLMIKTPGQTEGAVVDALASNLDLLPTLAHLVEGLDPGEGTGRNLFGALEGDARILVENSDAYPVKYYGLRTKRWKFLLRAGEGSPELYNLTQDPEEVRDLSAVSPKRLARYRRLLRRALDEARANALRTEPPVEPNAATSERLRELGYVE
jgi:arylsulfatase A-like enzyme